MKGMSVIPVRLEGSNDVLGGRTVLNFRHVAIEGAVDYQFLSCRHRSKQSAIEERSFESFTNGTVANLLVVSPRVDGGAGDTRHESSQIKTVGDVLGALNFIISIAHPTSVFGKRFLRLDLMFLFLQLSQPQIFVFFLSRVFCLHRKQGVPLGL